MPKQKQYKQKFRSEWLKHELFREWLLEVKENSGVGHCKLCKCDINAKYSDLVTHMKSKKHINANPGKTVPLTNFLQISPKNSVSKLEGTLAMFVSCHLSIVNTDHLVDLCKNRIDDSKTTTQLKMHRTKCSEMIKTVIANHFEEDLVNDIGGKKFSLLLDESNDITVNKLLGIVVIYYSDKLEKTVSTFLNLVKLEQCDAQHIADAVKCELANKNLNLKNLLAIGTDNASVMVGVNNGVYQKLKKDIPNLILIKCTCHSLQLAMSHASSDSLPRNLEYLIAETHKWFSNSATRQLNYCNLYQSLNDGKSPLKIPMNCKTRWLSIEPAVERIISQWTELKAHFEITRRSEKCFMSEILHEMYCDERNLAFLLFLHPILKEIQQVNKSFESENPDKAKLLEDLTFLIKSYGQKLVLPSHHIDVLNCNVQEYLDPKPYLGYRFESKITELNSAGKLKNGEELVIRDRCKNFLLSLFNQLKQRLPENIEILKTASVLSVKHALQPVKDNETLPKLLKCLGAADEDIEAAQGQFMKIHLIDWTNSTDTEKFWTEVHKYRNSSGFNPFKELSEHAISMLILPHSNAHVERLFSSMNHVKSKSRNRMELQLLGSLLTIKFGLMRHKKCCHNYELPANVIQAIGTMEAYASKETTTGTSQELLLLDVNEPSTSGQ